MLNDNTLTHSQWDSLSLIHIHIHLKPFAYKCTAFITIDSLWESPTITIGWSYQMREFMAYGESQAHSGASAIKN